MSTTIDQLYIFDGLSKEEIANFIILSQTQYRKAGEVILREGDPSNGCAYYLNSGKVRVIQSGKMIAELTSGSFFGEIALITDEPRNATIEVIEDVEIQVFLKDYFLELLQKSVHAEEMKEEVMRRIKERVK